MAALFSVVHFTAENTYDYVPNTWLSNGSCLWPDGASARKIGKLRSRFACPTPAWKKQAVKILHTTGMCFLKNVFARYTCRKCNVISRDMKAIVF